MKYLIAITFMILLIVGCKNKSTEMALNLVQPSSIQCDDYGCYGTYTGPEFVNGSDIAHQLSNKMCQVVGYKLKELYSQKKYVQVDFSTIKMSTKGMGTGKVVYALSIPFKVVNEKCEAYTSFDHVGGWNHTPDLLKRKQELNKVLMKGQLLDISDLKTTPEGLQEYWIQWKSKKTQSNCN